MTILDASGLPMAADKRAPSPSVKFLSMSGWRRLGEFRPGDLQRRMRASPEEILCFPYAHACITQIATDIAKMRILLMRKAGAVHEPVDDGVGIVRNALELLQNPNRWQVRKKLIEHWLYSVLLTGNAYVLIVADENGRGVKELVVLDPARVTVRVDEEGNALYQLRSDNLAGFPANVFAPADAIIHHSINNFYHPLCGMSSLDPIVLPVSQGLSIIQNSAQFFENGAQPGGILSSDDPVPEDEAERLRDEWDHEFTGQNAGRVAILGFGLKYQQLMQTARASQLAEQLKITAEMVCSALHVPPWIVGVQPIPQGHKPSELQQIFYQNCLQTLVEDIEALLDKAFGFGGVLHFQFDVDDLLRMDQATKVNSLAASVAGNLTTINEGRRALNYKPLENFDRLWMQMQDLPSDLALMLHQLQLERARREADAAGKAAAPVAGSDDDEERAVAAFVKALAA